MTLLEWKKLPGNTLAGLAAAIGVSKGHLTNLANNRRGPSHRIALRIAEATGGLVPVSSWPETVEREKREAA